MYRGKVIGVGMRIKKENVVDLLTRPQMQEIRETIKNIRDLCIIFVGIECGCRVGEMSTIRLDEIDWKGRILIKYDSKKKKKGTEEHIPRKCGFSPWLSQQLQLYINAFKPEGVLFNLSEKRYEQILQGWCEEIGLHDRTNDPPKSWVSWHVVRRTYINQAGPAGVEIQDVQEVTGDTLATILKYYKRANPGDQGIKMMKFYQAEERRSAE
jgi:integrase/recombinase XerD